MLSDSLPARVLSLGDGTTLPGLPAVAGEICGFFTLLAEGSGMSEATKVVLGTIAVTVVLSLLVLANLILV